MASKFARKHYYEVRTYPGRELVSRHFKLANAKKAFNEYKGHCRVTDQDGRAFY